MDAEEQQKLENTRTMDAEEQQQLENLLRRAETVLRARTDRLVLVLERVLDTSNWIGALRTAECLGIQNVWVVQLPRGHAQEEKAKAKQLQKERSKQGQLLGPGGLKAQRQDPLAQRKRHHAPSSQGQQTGNEGDDEDTDMAAAQHPNQQGDARSGAAPEQSDAQSGPEAAQGTAEAAAAEVLGASRVVPEERLKQEIRKRLRFSRASSRWLDVRFFSSTQACVQALRDEGCAIWATDLSQTSVSLVESPALEPLPARVAIIMGREADGVSKEMLQAADRRVFLPMYGWTVSLNVMVATGMVLQATLARWPALRGAMGEERRQALRVDWWGKLGKTDAQREALQQRAVSGPHVEPFSAQEEEEQRVSGAGGLMAAEVGHEEDHIGAGDDE